MKSTNKQQYIFANRLITDRLFGHKSTDPNNVHTRELIEGSSTAFIYKVTGLMTGYLFTLLITRTLGADAMGIFALSTAILNVFSVMGRFGFDLALLRFVAEYSSQGRMDSVKEVYISSLKVVVPLCLLLSALLFFSSPYIAKYIFRKEHFSLGLKIVSFAVLPMGLISMNSESLRGLKKIKEYAFLTDMSVSLFAAALLVIFLPFTRSGYIPLIAYTSSIMFVFILSLTMWLRNSRINSILKKKTLKIRSLLDVSMPMFLSSSLFLIMGWTDTVMLGIFRTEGDVGIYNVAMKVATLTSVTLLAINAIAAPKFAEFYGKGDRKRLGEIVNQSSKLIFWSSLPILLVFFIFPSFILGIFGNEFKAGTHALLLLTFGQFINAISGSVGYILQMTGKQKPFHYIILIATLINIGLNVLLIPEYGMSGAAFASMVSIIFWNIVSMFYIRSYLNITTFYLPGL